MECIELEYCKKESSRNVAKFPKADKLPKERDEHVYIDDLEEETMKRKSQRTSQMLTVVLGIATLVGIAVGIVFSKNRHNVSVRKQDSSIQGNSAAMIDSSVLEIHSAPLDCWLVLHDNVYDLTAYAPRHPGGAEWITNFCGTDATEFYSMYHPKALLRAVPETLVGTFSNSISTEKPTDDTPILHENGDNSIALATLKLHSTPDDCWLALHGTVYDLTEYAPDHPGGEGWITDYCGMDATSYYSIYHEEILLRTVSDTIVGKFAGESQKSDTTTDNSTSRPVISTDSEDDGENDDDSEEDNIMVRTTVSPTRVYLRPTEAPTEENISNGISLATVELHAWTDDCWIVLHDGVYDLTEYAPTHPGGRRWITDFCGTDATDQYTRFHKEKLLQDVSESFVGLTEEASVALVDATEVSQTDAPEADNLKDGISFAALQAHSFSDDCWIILHGSVYDLTEYAPSHPGGRRWITDFCGTDATDQYSRFHKEKLLQDVSDSFVGFPVPTSSTNTLLDDNLEDGSISLATIERHSYSDDCWIVLHGSVYDLTEYAPTHPGGRRWITDFCGTDATDQYSRFHKEKLLREVPEAYIGAFGYN